MDLKHAFFLSSMYKIKANKMLLAKNHLEGSLTNRWETTFLPR